MAVDRHSETVACPRSAPDRIDAAHAALIGYYACRRALTPVDPARRQAMRPVLDAWVALIGACRARAMPIIYTTPVSRADGANVVLLPTDLSVQTGVPSLTNCMYARVRTLEQALAMLA